MTDTTPAPAVPEGSFSFDKCEDAAACKASMARLLAPHMDWTEIHCGKCGAQGIIRHADILPAAPTYKVVPVEPEPAEPVAAPDAAPEAPAGKAAKA